MLYAQQARRHTFIDSVVRRDFKWFAGTRAAVHPTTRREGAKLLNSFGVMPFHVSV